MPISSSYIKIICRRFYIVEPITFEMCTPKMFEIIVEKHTETV